MEALLDVRLPIFSWFKDWGAGWDATFARAVATLAPDVAYDLVVGWEAWNVDLGDVALGAHDRFLADFFDGARTYPGAVVLRLFHEMNGNWYPWSVAAPGRRVADLGQWKQAWRRVVRVARSRKADNVIFAFCANADDVGGLPVEAYWPGSDWVDLVGLDGYNWDWHPDGNPLRTAEQLVEPIYRRVTDLHPAAEVIVGEIGCAAGGAKAEWYRRLYLSTRFPRVTRLAFFDEKKERDWRLESDAQSLAVNSRFLKEAPLTGYV